MIQGQDTPEIWHELSNSCGNRDSVDSYRWVSIDGTKTKVYTKYLTGTTDNDALTAVTHNIADFHKILSMTVHIYNGATDYINTTPFYSHSAPNQWISAYAANTVNISSVGANFQGKAYRIRLDYYL